MSDSGKAPRAGAPGKASEASAAGKGAGASAGGRVSEASTPGPASESTAAGQGLGANASDLGSGASASDQASEASPPVLASGASAAGKGLGASAADQASEASPLGLASGASAPGKASEASAAGKASEAASPGAAPSPPATRPLDGLLAGLRLALGTGDAADRKALAQVRDWRALGVLALRHRASLLFLQGADLGKAAPPLLARRRRLWLRRGLEQMAELKQAVHCLESAGVPCLVLKGLPLSRQLHGHPLARESGDIDLLVAPATLAAAEQALAAAGWRRFRPAAGETAPRLRRYRRFAMDYAYQGPRGTTLELHWRLDRNPYYLDLPFEQLRAAAVAVEIGEDFFHALGAEDCLLYLVAHAARHHWQRFQWLCDLALLFRSLEPPALARAAARAQQAGLGVALEAGLLLCRDALGAAVSPAAPSWRARLAAAVARLAWGRTGLAAAVIEEAVARPLVRLAVAPGARCALREITLIFVWLVRRFSGAAAAAQKM